MLETDGPYEGATCALTESSGFVHVNNSQIAQAPALYGNHLPHMATTCLTWQYEATVSFYREIKNRFNTFVTFLIWQPPASYGSTKLPSRSTARSRTVSTLSSQRLTRTGRREGQTATLQGELLFIYLGEV